MNKLVFNLVIFFVFFTATACANFSSNFSAEKVYNEGITNIADDQMIASSFVNIIASNLDPTRHIIFSNDTSNLGEKLALNFRNKGFSVLANKNEIKNKKTLPLIFQISSDPETPNYILMRLWIGDNISVSRIFVRNQQGQLIAFSPFSVAKN